MAVECRKDIEVLIRDVGPTGIGQQQNLGLFVWAWNSPPDRYVQTLDPELAETVPNTTSPALLDWSLRQD